MISRSILHVFALLVVLSSCGGGGSSSDTTPGLETGEPTPIPSLAPTQAPAPQRLITSISIADVHLKACIDVAAAVFVEELKSLECLDTQIESIDGLQEFTSLVSLSIESTRLKDITLLSHLSALTELRIDSQWITDLSSISKLSKLKALSINTELLGSVELLNKLAGLESLWITTKQKSISISHFSSLTNLTQLHISLDSYNNYQEYSGMYGIEDLFEIQDLHVLSDFKKLSDLTLWGLTVNNLSDISDITQLKHLNLRFNRQDIELTGLSRLVNLESLELLSCGQASGLNAINGLVNLERLSILDCNSHSESKIDLSKISGLTNLSYSAVNVAEIDIISNLRQLKSLELKVSANIIPELTRLNLLDRLTRFTLKLSSGDEPINTKLLVGLKNRAIVKSGV